MDEQHFTAWVTTDTSCLDGANADVVILRDEHSGDPDDKTPWTTAGGDPEVFKAVTGVPATDDDSMERAMDEAADILHEAGWRTEGEWESVPTGAIITVARA